MYINEAEKKEKGVPVVSVIVPIHNQEQYIDQCVKSILKQTYDNLDIILVDDASTDASYAICEAYKGYKNRITLVRQTECRGVSHARNVGLSHAVGEYIIFVDSDDYIPHNYIQALVIGLQETEADIQICGYTVINDSGQVIKRYSPTFTSICSLAELGKRFPEMMDKKYILSVWGKLYRKGTIDEKRLAFNETFDKGEDLIFNIGYFYHVNSVGVCKDAMYRYRIKKENTLSRQIDQCVICDAGRLFQAACQFCHDRRISNSSVQAIEKYYFKYLLVYIESLYLVDYDELRIQSDIETMLCQKEMKLAISNMDINDIELLCYKVLFSFGSKSIIKGFAKMRKTIKKALRGY